MVNLAVKLFQDLDINCFSLSHWKCLFFCLIVSHGSCSDFRCGEEPVFSPVWYIVP